VYSGDAFCIAVIFVIV